jgi:hypothetical protein
MSLDHFYMTGAGVFGYAVVYLPLAIFVLWQIYSQLLRQLTQLWLRGVLVFVTSAIVLTVPFWDVIAIGREAERLCKEQAGLHIYKTAEAEGFVGGGIGYWSKYGFTYTETGGRGEEKFRYTIKDGKEVKEQVPEYISRYQLQVGADVQLIGKHFSRNSQRVIDRQTNEVLGELLIIKIYPGRFDSIFIGLTGTGSGFKPWLCGYEPPPGRTEKWSFRDVVIETLKPRKNVEGEKK